MKTAIIKYDNGDEITTSINGTDKEIKEYYSIGKNFNLGNGEQDLMAKVTDCEVIPTASTTKEHYEKYKEMSEKIGLDLSDSKTILKLDRCQMIRKLKEDEYLNNIPLKNFDLWSNNLILPFTMAKIPYSISNGVCCIKHQIIYQFIGADFVDKETHRVTRDGEEFFKGSDNECWVYIHKHQGQSVDWACKHEGWKIEELEVV